MSPEFIREVRKTSSHTNLRAQRIAEQLKQRSSEPPDADKDTPKDSE